MKKIITEELNTKLRDLPETCGVYLLYDDKGNIIYVGKSINLKKRVMSYFRKNSTSMKKTQILSKSVHNVETHNTETELEALILEDELIKKNLPEYNIKQKEYREYQYLIVSDGEFPHIFFEHAPVHKMDHKVFGPFKDSFLADKIKDILCETFLVRHCTTKVPKNKCIRYDIGQCSGSCRGQISPEEYSLIMSTTLDFLGGEIQKARKIIKEKITSHAEKLEFEQAALWRDRLRFCVGFCSRQKFISSFLSKLLIIEENAQPSKVYIFHKGNLIKIYNRKPSENQMKKYIENLKEQHVSIEVNSIFLLDRAMVVYMWLRMRKIKKDHYFIS
jgi:excinuclease ABC subunit C